MFHCSYVVARHRILTLLNIAKYVFHCRLPILLPNSVSKHHMPHHHNDLATIMNRLHCMAYLLALLQMKLIRGDTSLDTYKVVELVGSDASKFCCARLENNELRCFGQVRHVKWLPGYTYHEPQHKWYSMGGANNFQPQH